MSSGNKVHMLNSLLVVWCRYMQGPRYGHEKFHSVCETNGDLEEVETEYGFSCGLVIFLLVGKLGGLWYCFVAALLLLSKPAPEAGQ